MGWYGGAGGRLIGCVPGCQTDELGAPRPHPQPDGNGETRAGWPVTGLRARSVDVAPMWLQPVGLLFVDGDHSYGSVVADYLAWFALIAPGGWLAFHDYFDDGELTIRGDTARVIDDVVIPSGLWGPGELTKKLWVARRLA